MKRYTFSVVITEGSDEFWEEIESSGKTGCDEMLDIMKAALFEHGFEPEIKLVRYEDN